MKFLVLSQGVQIHSLDLGLLQAGASVKGEFENRLKDVINEVKVLKFLSLFSSTKLILSLYAVLLIKTTVNLSNQR